VEDQVLSTTRASKIATVVYGQPEMFY